MASAIDYDGVVSMCRRLGFEPANNGKFPVLRYTSPTGFNLEFPAQWMKEGGTYSDEQVAMQLQAMLKSVQADEKVYTFLQDQKNVDRITKACLDFGMVYDRNDERFYYLKGHKAVFAVDHDYIASLVCSGKASMDALKELLETFLETAEFEHEKSKEATGKSLMQKGKRNARKRADNS